MIVMPSMLLSSPALGFLPILLLHLVSIGYLLTRRAKTGSTWWFTLWMISLMLLMASQGLARLVYAPVGAWIDWLGIPCAWFGLIPALQFAHTFPHPFQPREARRLHWVVLSLGGLLLAVTAWEMFYYPWIFLYNFTQFWYLRVSTETLSWFSSTTMLNILLPLGYAWVTLIWVRKTVYFTRRQAEADQKVHPGGVRGVLAALWHPKGGDAQAARSFAGICAIVPAVILFSAFEQTGLLPTGSFAAAYMPSIFILVITYLNYSREPSSLLVKWVGITLVAVLVILEVMNGMVFDLYVQTEEQVRQSNLSVTEALLTSPEGWSADKTAQIPAQIVYIAERPAVGGIFSPTYRMLFTRATASAQAISAETLQAEDARLMQRIEQNLYDVWFETPWLGSILQAGQQLSTQAWNQITFPPGVPSYRGIYHTDGRQHYIRYMVAALNGGSLYEVGFSYLEYRQRLHQRALGLVLLIWIGSGVILIVYPLFFRSNLARPLAGLLAGVQQVNAGSLEVRVEVHTEDEVGFLARSFNNMVRSLHDLNASLRLEISERTRAEAALSESEARFRNLFEYLPLSVFEVEIDPTQSRNVGYAARQMTGRILRANHRVERVYGWTAVELSNASLDKIFPPQAMGDLWTLVDALPTGHAPPVESIGRRRNGAIFPIRVSAATEASSALTPMILTIEDISDEKARRSEEHAIAEERRRIAREIHDGLAQDLAALRLRADIWHTLVERDPARLHDELDRLKEVLGQNIREVRRSIFALRPATLDKIGFDAALQKFVSDWGEQTQIHVEMQVTGQSTKLPTILEPVLFRIIQEALNNISKHAQADTTWLRLQLNDPACVRLSVRDNGVGFDAVAWMSARHSDHLGLVQMRERVEALCGEFQITSQPGQGSVIQITVPMISSRLEGGSTRGS